MDASPIDPETKAAVRRHVETTTWPLADIARDGGVSLRTVNDWITRGRWRRPNVTARPALTPERLDATRRGYEAGLRALDLGILNGRSRSWMAKLAQAKGWRRPGTPAGASQPEDGAVRAASRPELAAIEAALLSDPLDRAELIPLVERATAVAAADALTARGAPRRRGSLSPRWNRTFHLHRNRASH
jgi:hypothetical protein